VAQVTVFPESQRSFEAYKGFRNDREGGEASIARVIGPEGNLALGFGIVRYQNVRTVWQLPFDEVIYVLDGSFTVTARECEYRVGAGDILSFPKGCAVRYDIVDPVTILYAESPSIFITDFGDGPPSSQQT
jgi:ethanolamine utilization protein EutQ